MPIRSRYVAVSAAMGLVLMFASCDQKSPPTSPPHPQQPGQPAAVTIVRLELVAPSEIAPGESVRLTANAIKSDGSVENVSSQAQWTPTDSPVVQLSPTGLATGTNRGEQIVSARLAGLSANARIFVLPKGTFRLAGTVNESGVELQKVTLEVIAGVGAGLTTLSATDGSYALYGVSGLVTIHLKKEGYVNATQQIDVGEHRTLDFVLTAESGRRDYSGTYALTITAPSPCNTYGTFPDDARRRVYGANVTQDRTRLTVTLTGADFIVTGGHGNRFAGLLDGTEAITFLIGSAGDFYYYYYDEEQIVERYQAGALIVTGTVRARGAPGLITGTLGGVIGISPRTTPLFRPLSGACYGGHGFEMVRR